MAVKNVNSKSWALTPSADGRRHSAYPSGNAPSGGNAALSWVAPEGIAVGKRLMLMSDGTHNLVLPNRHRFTGFSQSSATDGAVPALSETEFDAFELYPPKYSSVARGQGRSLDMVQETANGFRIVPGRHHFEEPVTEVFATMCLRVPSTSYLPFTLPEQDPGAPGVWPNDSMWKLAWLLDVDGQDNKNDLVIGNINAGDANIFGNANTRTDLDCGSVDGAGRWWRFDKWVRISFWAKAGAVPYEDDGNLWFEACNTEDAAATHTHAFINSGGTQPNLPVFTPSNYQGDGNDRNPFAWGWFNFGGWSDARPTKDFYAYHTDFMIGYGANAAARLELGNAATWGACTDRAVMRPVKRHNSKMTEYQIERGGIDLSGDSWLYYVDGNNNATLVGKFT